MSSTADTAASRYMEILVLLGRGEQITVGDLQWLCSQYEDKRTQAETAAAQLEAVRPVCVAAEEYVRLRTESCELHGTRATECPCWAPALEALTEALSPVRAAYLDFLLPDAPEPEPEEEPAEPTPTTPVEPDEPDEEDLDDADDLDLDDDDLDEDEEDDEEEEADDEEEEEDSP